MIPRTMREGKPPWRGRPVSSAIFDHVLPIDLVPDDCFAVIRVLIDDRRSDLEPRKDRDCSDHDDRRQYI